MTHTLNTIIEPDRDQLANTSIIVLHGSGGQGDDFRPLIPLLQLPATQGAMRFLLPDAARRPTDDSGIERSGWYDRPDDSGQRDDIGLAIATAWVQVLIESEIERDVDSRRIFLVGFQQGAEIACRAALTFGSRLGGVVAMSTDLSQLATDDVTEANRDLPLLIQHGFRDDVIAEHRARSGADRLKQQGLTVEYLPYDMPHGFCTTQIHDVRRWLGTRLKAAPLPVWRCF
ncbi:phospholipase/carboxylesterase [Kushneria sinocarnis]|uniref:Phospholipase/carboxylesterase n=1 Tax=Kushneria sinocarnis TaxID=595502 RepID=A0A420WW08_9GAMM|nr:carboxylesterase [Kushneria sinocarnis]RKR03295.1 phospholipase/carboxylesterase [Kushneria sinocarnis]